MMRASVAFSSLFLPCACPVATVEGDEGGGGESGGGRGAM